VVLEVVSSCDAEELSFRGGDERGSEVPVAEALRELVGGGVGSDRRRPAVHASLDGRIGRGVECAGAEASEEHTGPAENQGKAVGRRSGLSGDVADLVGQAALHNVISGELAGRDELGVSLDREVVGEPVGLAGDVVVDVCEAERFEPARGSWAHVSEVVVAVDDDRPPSV
jgi:hypothetical protein